MLVIICGGDADREDVFWALDYWLSRIPITKIVTAGKTVAEKFAIEWAAVRRVGVIEEQLVKAGWAKEGGSATAALNRAMIARRPEKVIAFAGDTTELLAQARSAGVKCIEVA